VARSPLQPVLRYLHLHRTTSDAELLRRFAGGRDGDAFAELVTRHGPMVLGVCRRILADAHAAEDAFQTTFLALARQARTFRRPTALPAWLHGVAVRTANKARGRRLRRTRVEATPRPARPAADPLGEISGRELLAVIDHELARLPETYVCRSCSAGWKVCPATKPHFDWVGASARCVAGWSAAANCCGRVCPAAG
jgi:hypothetical protein